LFLASKFGLSSCSYLVNHDGTFITHPDEDRIMRDNFYNHIESCNGSDAEALIANMTNGKMNENKSLEKFVVDDQECYVFYVPVKYTNWVMVTVVPCHAIDIVGYINGCVLILVLLIIMLAIVLVCYFYVRSGMEPMKNLTLAVDDIAKGKYDTPMPELKHNDEINGLSESIEKMQFGISNIVDAAKSKG
jgi:sigma-B regulation protein RsbU (phosphoserine phosphatase)